MDFQRVHMIKTYKNWYCSYNCTWYWFRSALKWKKLISDDTCKFPANAFCLSFDVSFFPKNIHCLKSFQIRSFFWFVFYCSQSECRKIRTRKNYIWKLFTQWLLGCALCSMFLLFHFFFWPMYHHKLTTPMVECHIRFQSFNCNVRTTNNFGQIKK